MKGLLIFPHLGLGDAIICNAIFRHYADLHELVCLPVKYHNVPSVQFMLRDVENIVIRPVEDDEDAAFFCNQIWKGEVLRLGCHSPLPFDGNKWDQEFFRHAGVPFEERWAGWKCEQDRVMESRVSANQFDICDYDTFVHDDPSRGLLIKPEFYEKRLWRRPERVTHIFLYWEVLQAVREIHCISSSFALFADSIDLPQNPTLFLHAYARPGEPLPTLKHKWEIIQ